MNDDFRRRIIVPIGLPLGVLGAILLIAYSLSRVLLAVPEIVAVFTALGVATYVLLVAFLVEARPRISSRALAVGTTLGIVAIVGAGVLSAVAGPRELHADEGGEGGAAAEAAEGGAEGATVEEIPEGALEFAAGAQIAWTEEPEGPVPAGEQTVALTLEGLPHTVVFEGVNGDEPIVAGDSEGVFTGTVTLEPGTYTYYCDIPGHESGMTGELTVE